MDKTFNLIVNGVGGQGVITLLTLIDEAAMADGYDVRSSELHGLSQRGGSVQTHVRFGKKVNSPLIENGKADLVISLEMLEALRQTQTAGKQTKFLINEFFLPLQGAAISREEVENQLATLKNEKHIVSADRICKEKLQNEVVSSTFLFGYAVAKNLIPISKEAALMAIEKFPPKHIELNRSAFNLGHENK
jgi:indolepyruvate ferredoxin oxidoreductase beta subunit